MGLPLLLNFLQVCFADGKGDGELTFSPLTRFLVANGEIPLLELVLPLRMNENHVFFEQKDRFPFPANRMLSVTERNADSTCKLLVKSLEDFFAVV